MNLKAIFERTKYLKIQFLDYALFFVFCFFFQNMQ